MTSMRSTASSVALSKKALALAEPSSIKSPCSCTMYSRRRAASSARGSMRMCCELTQRSFVMSKMAGLLVMRSSEKSETSSGTEKISLSVPSFQPSVVK
jgi:proline racemase